MYDYAGQDPINSFDLEGTRKTHRAGISQGTRVTRRASHVVTQNHDGAPGHLRIAVRNVDCTPDEGCSADSLSKVSSRKETAVSQLSIYGYRPKMRRGHIRRRSSTIIQ